MCPFCFVHDQSSYEFASNIPLKVLIYPSSMEFPFLRPFQVLERLTFWRHRQPISHEMSLHRSTIIGECFVPLFLLNSSWFTFSVIARLTVLWLHFSIDDLTCKPSNRWRDSAKAFPPRSVTRNSYLLKLPIFLTFLFRFLRCFLHTSRTSAVVIKRLKYRSYIQLDYSIKLYS